ncbi:MAG: amidohydrolase family protein [Chthoniobacterales bacterium]
MDGPPIENGAVAVSGDRIITVGKFDDVKASHSGEIVDLGERALLPGLINAHCHLDYTCLRGKIPRPNSFADWIRAINTEKAKLSEADYLESIGEGFAEAKKSGTTTILNLTAFPELVAKVESASIRTWWFAELIDVRQPERAKEIVDLAVQALKPAKHWGLAPHALYTASRDLFRRCEEVARRENILLTTHLAESREEMSMFGNVSGPLYEFLKEIGRDMGDCGGITPIARFLAVKDSSTPLGMTKEWIIAHVNELVESDVDLLGRSTRNLSVVHCPRSHLYFGHAPFQYEKLRQLGFNICLGTDSLASNEDLSLFAEMRQFRETFPSASPEEVLRMVTVNPARGLRPENVLGKICPGAHVDLIAAPFRGDDVFEEIIGFEGRPWVMAGGLCA